MSRYISEAVGAETDAHITFLIRDLSDVPVGRGGYSAGLGTVVRIYHYPRATAVMARYDVCAEVDRLNDEA